MISLHLAVTFSYSPRSWYVDGMSQEYFSLQTDDSSGFLNEYYTLAFVKFRSNNTFQEKKFVFCKELPGTSKSLRFCHHIWECRGLSWRDYWQRHWWCLINVWLCESICFSVKKKYINIITMNCFFTDIYCCSKILENEMKNILASATIKLITII